MGERYLVSIKLADDPAAAPEPGEDGCIYEYQVMDGSRVMFTTYDREDANLAARALNELERKPSK